MPENSSSLLDLQFGSKLVLSCSHKLGASSGITQRAKQWLHSIWGYAAVTTPRVTSDLHPETGLHTHILKLVMPE